jgi:hypothetical protein
MRGSHGGSRDALEPQTKCVRPSREVLAVIGVVASVGELSANYGLRLRVGVIAGESGEQLATLPLKNTAPPVLCLSGDRGSLDAKAYQA